MSSVIAWIRGETPAGATLAGNGSGSTWGVTNYEYIEFTFAEEQPALTLRGLEVMVAPDGPGQVAIRADAGVIWDPLRSPASIIDPSSVSTIKVSFQPGRGFPGTGSSKPSGSATSTTPAKSSAVTVSDPQVVRNMVTLIDSLPVDNEGIHGCPALTGAGFTLQLIATDGTALASVSGNSAECGGLSLTVAGKSQPAVDDPSRALLDEVGRLLGVSISNAV